MAACMCQLLSHPSFPPSLPPSLRCLSWSLGPLGAARGGFLCLIWMILCREGGREGGVGLVFLGWVGQYD